MTTATEPTTPLSAGPAAAARALPWKTILLVVAGLASSLIFLFHYGPRCLASWDEATYAEIARQMLVRHNWLDLWVNGQPFMDKPPLQMWMIAVCYSLFGVSELATRIPSAVCGGLSVVLFVLTAQRLFNWRVAAIAGAILPCMEMFIDRAALGDLDSALLAFTLGTLYSYVRKGYRLTPEAGIWLGLAVLTKGAGGILPLLIIGAFSLVRRERRLLPGLGVFGAAVVTAIVSLPWHLYMTWLRGYSFWESYALFHVLKRSTDSIEGQSSDPIYYLKFMQHDLAVFLGLILLGLAWLAVQSARKEEPEQADASRFVLAWFLVPFVLFNLVHNKLFWYMLPCYPALAIAAGLAVDQLWNQVRTWLPEKPWARYTAVGLVTVGMLAAARYQPQDWEYWWFTPKDGLREICMVTNINQKPGETLNVWVPDSSVNDPKWYAGHMDPHVTLLYAPDILFYHQGPTRYLANRAERADFLAHKHGWLVGTYQDLGPRAQARHIPFTAVQSYYVLLKW